MPIVKNMKKYAIFFKKWFFYSIYAKLFIAKFLDIVMSFFTSLFYINDLVYVFKYHNLIIIISGWKTNIYYKIKINDSLYFQKKTFFFLKKRTLKYNAFRGKLLCDCSFNQRTNRISGLRKKGVKSRFLIIFWRWKFQL